jgi:hypothetical protein
MIGDEDMILLFCDPVVDHGNSANQPSQTMERGIQFNIPAADPLFDGLNW